MPRSRLRLPPPVPPPPSSSSSNRNHNRNSLVINPTGTSNVDPVDPVVYLRHGSLTRGSAPFQSQLEYLSQTQQQQPPQNVAPYGQQHFDMSSMAGALPGQSPMTSRPYASPDPSQGLASPNPYQQAMYPPTQRGGPRFDPAMMARAQQQQFTGAQYGGPGPMQNMPRQPGFPMQQQVPFSPVDPYAFGINPAQYSPIDPRFGPPGSFVLPAGLPTDIGKANKIYSTSSLMCTDHCYSTVCETRFSRYCTDPQLSPRTTTKAEAIRTCIVGWKPSSAGFGYGSERSLLPGCNDRH